MLFSTRCNVKVCVMVGVMVSVMVGMVVNVMASVRFFFPLQGSMWHFNVN